VGPGAGLDDMEERKILTLPGLELRPLDCPAHSIAYEYPSKMSSNPLCFHLIFSRIIWVLSDSGHLFRVMVVSERGGSCAIYSGFCFDLLYTEYEMAHCKIFTW
jgi:hypothetical protein